MSPERSPALRAARELLISEELGADADAKAIVAALGASFDRLGTQLGSWIGRDGFAALAQRGIARARTDHPALADARFDAREGHLARLEGLSAASPAEARAAAEAVLAHMVDHLGRLIGPDVAMRLVMPAHPESWNVDNVDDGASE